MIRWAGTGLQIVWQNRKPWKWFFMTSCFSNKLVSSRKISELLSTIVLYSNVSRWQKLVSLQHYLQFLRLASVFNTSSYLQLQIVWFSSLFSFVQSPSVTKAGIGLFTSSFTSNVTLWIVVGHVIWKKRYIQYDKTSWMNAFRYMYAYKSL